MLTYGSFIADQLANSDGLESCRALNGLREALGKREARAAREAEEESPDPNKRQRKATKVFEAAPSHTPRAKPVAKPKPRAKAAEAPKVGEKDPTLPKPPQTAYMYYFKEMRPLVIAEHSTSGAEGGTSAGGAPSFTEIGKICGERWKAASAEEKGKFEAIAEADKERFDIEMRAHKAEQEAKEAAKAKRGAKRKSLDKEAGGGDAAATPDGGGGGGGESGAGGGGGSPEAGSKRRRSEGGDGGGAAPAEGDALFPMEDLQLQRRETAHRAMLLASGRSKPTPPPAIMPAPAPIPAANAAALPPTAPPAPAPAAASLAPAYVYPPCGPPPPVLPPFPEMPSLTPLRAPPVLGMVGMSRLIMLWDCCNMLGETFKLRPREMPLDAMVNAICGQSAADLALASSVVVAMMRVLARDLISLDNAEVSPGWEPWLHATADGALLPILWPQLLADLLEQDASYSAWDATYATSPREEVVGTLRTREWDGLTPSQRLDVLCWLSENTSQCQTVRSHLERNFDASVELRRLLRQQLDEEASREGVLRSCRSRIEGMEHRMAEWKAQQAQRLAARKKPLGSAPDFAEELAAERSKEEEETVALAGLRARRLEIQAQIDEMPLRSEPMGRDRHGRTYIALSGAPAAHGLVVHVPADAAGKVAESAVSNGVNGNLGLSDGGSWSWIEGVGALRQLFGALHPDGMREGELLGALRKHRLSAVLHQTLNRQGLDEILPSHPTAAVKLSATTLPSTASTAVAAAAQGPHKVRSASAIVEPVGYRPPGSGDGAVEPAAADGAAAVNQRLLALAAAIACADDVADARALHLSSKASSESKQARAEARAEARESKADAAAGSEAAASPAVAASPAKAGSEPAGEEVSGEEVGNGEDAPFGASPNTPMQPPPPPAPPPLPVAVSAAVEAVAARASELLPPPPCTLPQLSMLKYAIRELEERYRIAEVAWAACPPAVRAAWATCLNAATHVAECAAVLRVLDAHLAPVARARPWGLDRSHRWRDGVLRATTVAAVAVHLIVLDDASAWDALERMRAKVGQGSTERQGMMRPRLSPLDFAVRVGESAHVSWLQYCEASPSVQSLRASAQGRLYTLTPIRCSYGEAEPEAAGWQWSLCGPLNDGSPADLKGLTASEAKGGKLTVWYEEMQPDRHSGAEKAVDMPYTGTVLGVHYRDGLSVVFNHTVGADGRPEKIHIANEDDWMWGTRRTKAAAWSLDVPPPPGREPPRHVSFLV